MTNHSPGRVVWDADWHELKLEENGYVIARLPRPHPKCQGKERADEAATIRANGEWLAALWNAAIDAARSGEGAARPAKDQRITLLWQGRGDGTNEGFEINGMLVVPAEEGVTYVRREDAIAFFGLVEPTAARAA